MKQHKKAFIAGTFDNFHVGHQYLLYQVSALADTFLVTVARSKTVQKIKGRLPKVSELQRVNRIKAENYANVVVQLGRTDANFFETLRASGADVLCLGYDQRFDIKKCQELLPDIAIVRLKPYKPEIFKSSKFLNRTA